MATGKPLPIKDLLGGRDSPVAKLLRRGAAVDALTAAVRGAVPDSLQAHVVAASVEGNTLRVTTDAGAWAPRIRYCARDILISAGRIQGHPPQKLEVRVRA